MRRMNSVARLAALTSCMGRSFQGRGWSDFHCTGLDRPALSMLDLGADVAHVAIKKFCPFEVITNGSKKQTEFRKGLE